MSKVTRRSALMSFLAVVAFPKSAFTATANPLPSMVTVDDPLLSRSHRVVITKEYRRGSVGEVSIETFNSIEDWRRHNA